jgi:hypothetical protein
VHRGSRLRYVYQQFRWTAARLANLKCDSNSTYEADAIFYNNNQFAHYLTGGGILGTATNLPDSYIDTQVDDNLKTPVFTIGTSDADKLQSSRDYRTMILTRPGSVTGERVVPSAQRGEVSGLCPQFMVQLCVFPKQSRVLLDTTPSVFYEMAVPGARSWIGPTG